MNLTIPGFHPLPGLLPGATFTVMYSCKRRCSICSPLQARAPAAVEADLSGDTRAAAGELETR